MKLDFNLTSVADRLKYIENLLASEFDKEWKPKELDLMSDYLVFAHEKEERKRLAAEGVEDLGKKTILDNNRLVTVNKRETSMESLIDKLEGGESTFHGLIKEDKNAILTPKTEIDERDLQEIADLKQLREEIDLWEAKLKEAPEGERFKIKKMIIEMRKDQYLIKSSYRSPIYSKQIMKSAPVYNFDSDTGYYDEDGAFNLVSRNALNLWNKKDISGLLLNYQEIKDLVNQDFDNDLYWLLVDLDKVIDAAIPEGTMMRAILNKKINKFSNEEIQQQLKEEFNDTHSQEYISSLWRNKIPQLISEKAKEQWVEYFYTFKAKGTYKKCSRCGENKLAINKYFSYNRTSQCGFYSICKECRNKKKKS